MTPPAETPARPRTPTANLALAIAIAAALGCVWLFVDAARSEARLRQQVTDYLARGDRTNTESRRLADHADNVARALDNRVGLIEQRIADWQGQQAAMESLYRNLARTRDEWVLGEIEQLLLTGSQQLELANNVNGALNALQTAEQILQRQPQPGLVPLRKALAADIERLRATPQRDVVGTVARIDTMIAAVDEWPLAHQFRLKGGERSEAGPTSGLASLWADLRDLIRVQYVGSHDLALVSPENALFLRENIKLRLTSARYAALRGDETQLAREVGLTREWLERYFNIRADAPRRALEQLNQLRRGSVASAPLDIRRSLEALREARRAFDKRG